MVSPNLDDWQMPPEECPHETGNGYETGKDLEATGTSTATPADDESKQPAKSREGGMAVAVQRTPTLELKDSGRSRGESCDDSGAATAEKGYQCEFVEQPPTGVQTECPLCLCVLRDPYLVTCCGSSFCRVCIEGVVARAEKGFGACPSCVTLASNYAVSPNTALQSTLAELHVRCPNACPWTGKLSLLDDHACKRSTAEPDRPPSYTQALESTEVPCSFCSAKVQRSVLMEHQTEECLKRPITCEHCSATVPFEAMELHWDTCGSFPTRCPNNCGARTKVKDLEHHVNQVCPLSVVDCDFSFAGCRSKQQRRELPEHLAASVSTHLSLLAAHSAAAEAKVVQLREEIEKRDKRLEELERDNYSLKEKVSRLDSYIVNIPPVTFELANFQKHVSELTEWYSPPFFSHPHGYMLCLKVNASGVGEARKHVSVSVQLITGDFDTHLLWPFLGVVSIQILNQLGDRDHHLGKISFCTTSNAEITGRVKTGGLAPTALTKSRFISHADLGYNSTKRSQYLKDDCLKFCIAKVENTNPLMQLSKQCLTMEPRVCIVPISFTMTNFEQRHRDDDHWYSPSFYTHLRGYRMCVGVCAQGKGDDAAGYLNVSAHIMQGQFDNMLKWPFRGSISVQLLNQLADKRHHTQTIEYTADTPDACATRIVTGERAMGIGLNFVSHAELGQDKSQHCQYLKNDTLQFRVQKVHVRS